MSWQDFWIMYYLIIWDAELAASGQDGALEKIEIPAGVAKYFFDLNAQRFPILSELSFDDFDLFSGVQLEWLSRELIKAAELNLSALKIVGSMIELIFKAKSLGKSVLFDPFGTE